MGSANAAFISGLPNDPGGTSILDHFYITNNVLKGTSSLIAAQNYDLPCLSYCNPLGTKTNLIISGNQLDSMWTGSRIDISGGVYGVVDTVLVESNTLRNTAGAQNVITQDNHTYNVTIRNNSL